jgi:hypothetical protein
MRQIINKGNTAEDLLATVDKVFTAGWKSIKLYFMLGLPGEQQTDLEGIIDLSNQALRAAKNRGQVTISLSTFVPKPHTPFQWQKQLSADETYARQNFIRQRIKKRNLTVKWHDARMSLLEGLFSRGDEKIGALLEAAYHKGCRFDGWGEILRFDLWQEAINETGIDPEYYLRERNTSEILPWDNIDCGVSREFLLQEKNRSSESPLKIAAIPVVKTAEFAILPRQKIFFQRQHNSRTLMPQLPQCLLLEMPKQICSQKYIALLLPNLTVLVFYPIWNYPWP